MARQLVEFRTPAAYTGVENYAHTHAGTEAGALAWFAIGYAHYLDAQYPAAITALQKAQPQIGELKDYVAFFIGNSYVLSNNPEESLAYLRDFGTRFPDSLYDHDATIANAKALLALNQPAEAISLLEAHRTPANAETEYYLGKAYVQNGQVEDGAEILQRVYYEYPTNYLADQAADRSAQDSGRTFAAAGHLRPAPEASRRTIQGQALGRGRRRISVRRRSFAAG